MKEKLANRKIKEISLVVLAIVIAIIAIYKITSSKSSTFAGDISVTISIECKNVLDKKLDPALSKYIPKDGIILDNVKISCPKESSVYDVLVKACNENDIQFEASYSPIYESYYVEGINYLYEFMGGDLSGWLYSVNGEFPSYGASSYVLSDGDNILWTYTDRGY